MNLINCCLLLYKNLLNRWRLPLVPSMSCYGCCRRNQNFELYIQSVIPCCKYQWLSGKNKLNLRMPPPQLLMVIPYKSRSMSSSPSTANQILNLLLICLLQEISASNSSPKSCWTLLIISNLQRPSTVLACSKLITDKCGVCLLAKVKEESSIR